MEEKKNTEIQGLLIEVQKELKAPKSQRNSFGNYNYRSQEDILEAVKPLLEARGLLLTIGDEVISTGNFTYIESQARVCLGDRHISANACAGIAEQKGMSIAQSFGSSSSYARKYALNGLFLIDDVKDDDTRAKSETVSDDKYQAYAAPLDSPSQNDKPWLNKSSEDWEAVAKAITSGERTLKQAMKAYKISKANQDELEGA